MAAPRSLHQALLPEAVPACAELGALGNWHRQGQSLMVLFSSPNERCFISSLPRVSGKLR